VTIREAIAAGSAQAAEAGSDTPGLDASLLLSSVLGLDRAALLAHGPDVLSQAQFDSYTALCRRRCEGQSVAYILGKKEFWGLEFIVTSQTLVPRPDTELLVELSLEFLKGKPARSKVLDCCTGSGCIAVSIAKERPDVSVFASDLSEEALGVANRNALELLGPSRVSFFHSDLLASVPESFTLIVSNPPYIPSSDISSLAAEVRGEPLLALDGGPDGLDIMRRLVKESRERLDEGGRLIVESGAEQAEAVAGLMEEAGFRWISIHKDLAGRDRATGGTVS